MDSDLFLGNCLEKLKVMPDGSVDLILIDPPYSINYVSNHGSDRYKERLFGDGKTDWDVNFNLNDYWSEVWRVLKPERDAYVFGRLSGERDWRDAGI